MHVLTKLQPQGRRPLESSRPACAAPHASLSHPGPSQCPGLSLHLRESDRRPLTALGNSVQTGGWAKRRAGSVPPHVMCLRVTPVLPDTNA